MGPISSDKSAKSPSFTAESLCSSDGRQRRRLIGSSLLKEPSHKREESDGEKLKLLLAESRLEELISQLSSSEKEESKSVETVASSSVYNCLGAETEEILERGRRRRRILTMMLVARGTGRWD